MKKLKNLLLAIVIMMFATSVFAQSGTIVVTIKGIENNTGNIKIGLYNSESTFPTYGEHFKGAELKADKSGVSYTFENIPAGTYAVAVWHDENDNKEMDKNFFGSPSESYGFSGNIYGSFGPPDFDEVSFKVISNKKTTINIDIE